MAIRFAAASSLALAAALFVSPVARAQSFFSFYDMSPRQVVGMLEDQGYDLRGPLVRRGDVYVCDVDSVSGRSMRLIVSAHDGHVLERFAASHRSHYDEDARTSRNSDEGDDRRNNDRVKRNDRTAFDDVLNPPSRVYGSDGLFASKPTPPERVPDAGTPRPKRQAVKKHSHTNTAKAPAAEPTPDVAPTTEAGKPTPSSMAAVAPAGEAPKTPSVVESVKPAETPRVVETPVPVQEARKPVEAPKAVEAPKSAVSPEPVQAKAEKAPDAGKPKSDGAHRKINDLPVGTLD